MRQASLEDLDFLAECYVKIARHMKSGEPDFYIERLPDTADDTIRSHVARYVGRDDALTLVEERDGKPVACLLASIGSASFAASRVGRSGHIAVCWVEPEHRRAGVAAGLVRGVEEWFSRRGVQIVELSYMARNDLAEVAWRHLGYRPFRVFAYKQLQAADDPGRGFEP